jgi:modulator of FtsH protease
MDRYPSTVVSTSRASALTTNKVLRNTYLLLGATLAFSAAMAGVAMALNVPHFGLFTLLVYFGLLFAVHKTRNSAWGVVWTFALTGFLGLTLGPILDFYLKALPNGSQVVMTSLGVTAAAFLGLSAYAVKSQKDFSFLGGFLFVGAIGAFVLGLVAVFFQLSTLSLVVSGMFLIVSSGYILWQTSEIIRGGETNYILATITLYVAIYNMFLSLLHLLGVASDD